MADDSSPEERTAKFKRAFGGDMGRFFNLVVFDETFEEEAFFREDFNELIKTIDNIRLLIRLFYWDETLTDFRLKDVDRWEDAGLSPGENKGWVKVFRRELIGQYKSMVKDQNDTLSVQADTNPIRKGDSVKGDIAGDINDLF